MKSLIPKMHGATSIWLSALLVSAFKLEPLEFLASVSLIFAIASGHNIVFKGIKSRVDYAVVLIFATLAGITALNNPYIALYAVPFALSVAFRRDFRKYVVFASILTTLPAAYIANPKTIILFISFAFASVLVADSRIYSDRRTLIAGIVVFSLISALVDNRLIPFTFLLAIPEVLDFKTKTLGLYLLAILLSFSAVLVFMG
ncbi:hypothetical protein [Geoglobus acetivorans]|uniref:Uncharacterized protein n=1 Tax=Geoglobus acetivorans TaxID=565033 RepID=A0ABZ3H362_GEOAI|nr:hypothetical protein [Geoglobus acetivorans]